jgi:membrane protein
VKVRPGELLSYYLGGLYRRADENHLFLLGGGLAFSIFVCIVPFVLVLFSVLGALLELASVESQVDFLVGAVIPYERQADFVREVLLTRGLELVAHKDVYGALGLFLLLFGASGLFSSMRTILDQIYRIPDRRRAPVGKLKDFGLVFLVLCIFLTSVTLSPVLEAVKDAAISTRLWHLPAFGLVHKLLYLAASSSLTFGVFFFLYAFVPYGKVGRRVTALSALCAVLLWQVAVQAFGYYINHFASFKQLYGTYALFVVVVFWIYYSSLIFITGAEIGQLYREKREQERGDAESP